MLKKTFHGKRKCYLPSSTICWRETCANVEMVVWAPELCETKHVHVSRVHIGRHKMMHALHL
jgi:hypothetical protein